MAQQLRELREQAHNLSIYTNVSRFDANMIHSSLSVDFRERVKNAGEWERGGAGGAIMRDSF